MKTTKKKYKILHEYLPNYIVKYCFFNVPIREDEGNGWYSTHGYNLVCNASTYKENQSCIGICSIEDLPSEYKELYLNEKLRYESDKIHLQRMQSYQQLLINKTISHEN